MSQPSGYVGRFAPSPTGPLHFGSLLAAVASYLEARAQGGRWFVRIEDIDPPREEAGASELIIRALERYGFEWDGPVLYQSASAEHHRGALARILEQGLAYYCDCSRRQLEDEPVGALGRIYPGTCRNLNIPPGPDLAVRLRTDNEVVSFIDLLQGKQSMVLRRESGDFIVMRRDGLVAYQLAVVVDDALQGVTDIVRGIDLMGSTPRQVYLQQHLGYPTPAYGHIPVAVDPRGDKLSKLTGAAALPLDAPAAVLERALRCLGQPVPQEAAAAGVEDIWRWAMERWDIGRLAGQRKIPVG